MTHFVITEISPFRRLISALVALWLRDNPNANGEQWIVDEHGAAVTVIIRRDKPEYVATDKAIAWSYSDN